MSIVIDQVEYSKEMVERFLNVKGKKDVLDLPRHWLEQHMVTFYEGYDLANDDAPDCDVCEKIDPEDGPPANHQSQNPNM